MMELAKRVEALTEPRVDEALVSALVRLLREDWRTLAICPVGCDVEQLHRDLRALSGQRAFAQVRVVDARKRTVDSLPELMEAVRGSAARQLFIVDPVVRSPVAQAIAQETDAAALVVKLGETELEQARDTVKLLGRDRFVGTLVLEEAK